METFDYENPASVEISKINLAKLSRGRVNEGYIVIEGREVRKSVFLLKVEHSTSKLIDMLECPCTQPRINNYKMLTGTSPDVWF